MQPDLYTGVDVWQDRERLLHLKRQKHGLYRNSTFKRRISAEVS